MTGGAGTPEDLGRLFLERASQGDVEGVVSLYAADAILQTPDGPRCGHGEIAAFYRSLLLPPRPFTGSVQPALVHGSTALTSVRFRRPDGLVTATSEVARRGDDGRWSWILDRPDVLADS